MNTVNIKDHPALALFLRRAFPAYRKHKAFIRTGESLTLSGGYWDGGSRSSYFAATPHGVTVDLRYNTAPAQFNGGKPDTTVTLTPDFLVVQAGTFCGKPATVTIHGHPDALALLGIQA